MRAVEDTKLDAGGVGDAAHQAVERVDFADEMAFAESADGRIAGHRANRSGGMGEEGRAGAHARGRGGGLAAGMAAADHDDVKRVHRLELHRATKGVFHVKQGQGVSRETPPVAF